MTIGWIHSHPTYDLFLSSVDLHNQLGYQLQLEEAVAIVYSPISKVSQTKAYRLRNDSMETILECQKEGFHEHIVENDYLQKVLPYQECHHIRYFKTNDYGINI